MLAACQLEVSVGVINAADILFDPPLPAPMTAALGSMMLYRTAGNTNPALLKSDILPAELAVTSQLREATADAKELERVRLDCAEEDVQLHQGLRQAGRALVGPWVGTKLSRNLSLAIAAVWKL